MATATPSANLFISRAAEREVGLFGSTGPAAAIRNLTLTGVNVAGRQDVGGLAGESKGSIDNVAVSGSVSAARRGAGGVAGESHGAISHSSASASTSGSSHAGGLVGQNYGSIRYSHATGSVAGTNVGIGGLAGENRGTIGASYATGSVGSANVLIAGGLVGENKSGASIVAAYATGDVMGDSVVGGLVGENYRQGRIVATYATGDLAGRSYVGGLIGENHVGVVFTDNYWEETSCDDTLLGVGSDDLNLNGVLDAEPVRTPSGAVREEKATAGVTCQTAAGLKGPTGYTGIYAAWNVDVDGDDTVDDPWTFGTNQDYPTLD